MSATVVKIASTPEELLQVYRFRYDVYVTEMGRNPPHVNYEIMQVRHPLDENGINIVAYDGSAIIGVLRTNFGQDGCFGSLREFYGIQEGQHGHPRLTSISTGLMVAATHRHRFIAPRLAIAGYECGLQRNIRWNFIDCIPPLAPFFKGFGWIEHLPEKMHPE
jgi:hypothetical protein